MDHGKISDSRTRSRGRFRIGLRTLFVVTFLAGLFILVMTKRPYQVAKTTYLAPATKQSANGIVVMETKHQSVTQLNPAFATTLDAVLIVVVFWALLRVLSLRNAHPFKHSHSSPITSDQPPPPNGRVPHG